MLNDKLIMAQINPEIRASDRQMVSLVLTIFKGENFVVKGAPCKVFVRAKCNDLQSDSTTMITGTIRIAPSNSEPEFNFQLAWSISRKQLKELRSNRSTIRVSCIVSDDKTDKEIEIGYVVMHVKDAIQFAPGVGVDFAKSGSYSLLGTRDPWKYTQPKLHMILHLEDSRESQDHGPASYPAKAEKHVTKDPQNLSIINAAKLAETKILDQVANSNRFMWTVNDQDGYFQLGVPSADDDLYILNTTVISTTNLHCLRDDRSPHKTQNDKCYWQIKYIAYGCQIASEPFPLDTESPNRLTFVGDKATARIRTNAALFFQYLEETSLEFHILRYQKSPQRELTNGEIMGFCFASLAELTDPNRKDLKLSMQVVTEWGTPRVANINEKPEVRVMLTLQCEPSYFARQVSLKNRAGGNDEVDGIDADVEDNGIKADDVADDHIQLDVEALSNTSNARRLLQFENANSNEQETSPGTSSALSSDKKRVSKEHAVDKHILSNATSCGFSDSEDSDSASVSNKENLAKLSPEPGTYLVAIELTRFWLKSKKLIKDRFALSYLHPPIGIATEPIESIGSPINSEFVDVRQGFMILDKEFTKTLRIKKLSENLLNKPLTVELCRLSDDGGRSDVFASAMIPFGRIFLEKAHDQVWHLEDAVDILKNSTNVKIGNLFFKIKLTRETDSPVDKGKKSSNPKQSSFFPPKDEKPVAVPKYTRDSKKADKVTEEMREWRKTQEEMYKRQKEDKESAYLKLLSDEAAKRDAEREEVMNKRLSEFDKKEKELNKKIRHLEEKEERLKLLELELKDQERKVCTEKESLHQLVQRDQKRFEEDHKVEIEALTRRMQGYLDEIDKLKRKNSHMEKKLEAKEAEIDTLFASKREHPDTRLQERVTLLEQENKTLKCQLREAIAKRELYKNQSRAICQKLQRVQDERDQELKDQNENLRLQILASKEHKELKKERKAVQDLSHTLKALQKETIRPAAKKHEGTGDQHDAQVVWTQQANQKISKDKEIQRLSEERERLLQTGAYTPYDMLIKELESKMVALARTD